MDDTENCPLCNRAFPVLALIAHVDRCTGEPTEENLIDFDQEVENDADFELAKKLQQEEDEENSKPRTNNTARSDEEFAKNLHLQDKQKSETAKVKCQLCSTETDLDELYILDDCTHKFCKPCLQGYVTDMIQKSVKLECPIKGCGKDLSVRDMKDLLPVIQTKLNGKNPLNPTTGTGKATERIMAEFKHIMKADPDKNGYSVKPVNDNIYKWDLKLFNFDKTDPIGQDMASTKTKYVLLNIVFPQSYPFFSTLHSSD